jgi:hypothetical protein
MALLEVSDLVDQSGQRDPKDHRENKVFKA